MRAAMALTVSNSSAVKKRGSGAIASRRLMTSRVFSFQDGPLHLERTS